MKVRTVLVACAVGAVIAAHFVVAFHVFPVRWRWPALGIAGVLLVLNAVWWLHKRHGSTWSRRWSVHDDAP